MIYKITLPLEAILFSSKNMKSWELKPLSEEKSFQFSRTFCCQMHSQYLSWWSILFLSALRDSKVSNSKVSLFAFLMDLFMKRFRLKWNVFLLTGVELFNFYRKIFWKWEKVTSVSDTIRNLSSSSNLVW